jgi:hypothetical protein
MFEIFNYHKNNLIKFFTASRIMWETHSTRAAVFKKLGRKGDENDNRSAADKIITEVVDSLSNRDLKSGFPNAGPVQEIIL